MTSRDFAPLNSYLIPKFSSYPTPQTSCPCVGQFLDHWDPNVISIKKVTAIASLRIIGNDQGSQLKIFFSCQHMGHHALSLFSSIIQFRWQPHQYLPPGGGLVKPLLPLDGRLSFCPVLDRLMDELLEYVVCWCQWSRCHRISQRGWSIYIHFQNHPEKVVLLFRYWNEKIFSERFSWFLT